MAAARLLGKGNPAAVSLSLGTKKPASNKPAGIVRGGRRTNSRQQKHTRGRRLRQTDAQDCAQATFGSTFDTEHVEPERLLQNRTGDISK